MTAARSLFRPTLLAVIILLTPAFAFVPKAQTPSVSAPHPSCKSRRGETFLSDDISYCLLKTPIPTSNGESFLSQSNRWIRQDERNGQVRKLIKVRIIARNLLWTKDDPAQYGAMKKLLDKLCKENSCDKSRDLNGLNDHMTRDDLLDHIVELAEGSFESERKADVADAQYPARIREMQATMKRLYPFPSF